MRGRFRYVAQCHRGHLFNVTNTRITREGYQVCRTCDRERKQAPQAPHFRSFTRTMLQKASL